MKFTADLEQEYRDLFHTMIVDDEAQGELVWIRSRIQRNSEKYEAVTGQTGVPWRIIATIHAMEGSLFFDRHLHNGDPLSKRTVHVPQGRPLKGTPPFSWEESAIDAIRYMGLHRNLNWSLGMTCYILEAYNGFGYRQHGIYTPYLWGQTNHHEKGKFVADGRFDPEAPTRQVGAAAILKALRAHELLEWT